MKKIFAFMAAFMFAVLPFSSAVPALAVTEWNTTGSYQVGFEYLGPIHAHDMVLVQNGSGNLTGHGGSPAGANVYTWVIDSGSVVGDVIDFTANYTATPDAVVPQTVLHVVGTIAPDGTMSGTWSDNYQGGSRSGSWSTISGTVTEVTNTTVVVSANTSAGENLPGWMFNRDTSTMTPFEFNTDQASIGTGSLYVKPIGATSSDKFIGEYFLNAPIADVDSVSYDFMIGSGGVATEEEQFYMNVYANFGVSDDLKFYDCRYDVVPTVGSTIGFTTVTFDPTVAYPVTTRGGASASPFTCPSVPADMDTLSASSTIRMFALTVGDTSASDVGLEGYLDNVVVVMGANATTYNFDPAAVNTAPVLTNIPASPVSIPELSLYSFDANATDADLPAQTLTFSLSSTSPAGASIDSSTGVFTWTPTEAQGPGSYTFSVMVSDGTLSDSESITINVTEVTDPAPTTPTDKDQCKDGGWKLFTDPVFKNQGQCVSYTNHN